MQDDTLYTCTNRDNGDPRSAGYFLPIFVTDLNKTGTPFVYTEGLCFQSITFEYDINYDSEGNAENVTINIDAQKPKSLFCKDWFFIGNTELYHVEVMLKKGKHQITFTNIDEDTLTDIQFGGFKIYMFCDGFVDTFVSAFKTLLCFLGGLGVDPTKKHPSPHIPPYMEKNNIEFLNETMGYDMVERPTNFVDIDPDLI
jgi:hypothetical protein